MSGGCEGIYVASLRLLDNVKVAASRIGVELTRDRVSRGSTGTGLPACRLPLTSIRKSIRRVPPAPSLLQKDQYIFASGHLLLTPSIVRTWIFNGTTLVLLETDLFVLNFVDFLDALSAVSGHSPSSFSSYLKAHGHSSSYSVRHS